MDKYNNFLEFCALENAIKFKGKANSKALIGKVLAKYPDKKNDMKSLMGEINTICDKINKLDLETQNKEFLKYNDLQKEKEDSLDTKKKIKAIVFDVDGVIINSQNMIDEIEERLFKKHSLNQKDYIKDLHSGNFDKVPIKKNIREKIFEDFEYEISKLKFEEIKSTTKFIQENQKNYLFFTNTAMSKIELEKRFKNLDISKHFKELFHRDSGDKKENILKILEKHNLKNDEILFIDDRISNIEIVRKLDANTIHFTDHNLNLEEEIERIEKILNFNELEK